ncbi:hypothetical protein OG21DRAFT_649029 [Imleria badia]|nr:hypothetical protein OG21DRAFT_649029 [Imleria badia]
MSSSPILPVTIPIPRKRTTYYQRLLLADSITAMLVVATGLSLYVDAPFIRFLITMAFAIMALYFGMRATIQDVQLCIYLWRIFLYLSFCVLAGVDGTPTSVLFVPIVNVMPDIIWRYLMGYCVSDDIPPRLFFVSRFWPQIARGYFAIRSTYRHHAQIVLPLHWGISSFGKFYHSIADMQPLDQYNLQLNYTGGSEEDPERKPLMSDVNI